MSRVKERNGTCKIRQLCQFPRLFCPLLVGCSFQAHSLPLSPYTHILDLEVKEA